MGILGILFGRGRNARRMNRRHRMGPPPEEPMPPMNMPAGARRGAGMLGGEGGRMAPQPHPQPGMPPANAAGRRMGGGQPPHRGGGPRGGMGGGGPRGGGMRRA